MLKNVEKCWKMLKNVVRAIVMKFVVYNTSIIIKIFFGGKIKICKQKTFIIKTCLFFERRHWYILKYILPGGDPRTPPCLRRSSGGPRGARLKTSALGDLTRKIYFKYQWRRWLRKFLRIQIFLFLQKRILFLLFSTIIVLF